MKEVDLIGNDLIKRECQHFLDQNPRVENVFVGDVEGNVFYAVSRMASDDSFNPDLVLSNMASALGIANNFFEREFKDESRSFTLFRLRHATVAVLQHKTIVVSDVLTQPQTTFEEKITIESYVAKMTQLAEKIDAVLTSLGSVPFLEKLKQAIPKAIMLGIFTETGTPIHVLKTGVEDLDDAYVAAVSAALTLSSQHVSESERQAMAVLGSKTMALIRKISPSSTMFSEQDQLDDEMSKNRILIAVLPRDDETGVEHYFTVIESILRGS